MVVIRMIKWSNARQELEQSLAHGSVLSVWKLILSCYYYLFFSNEETGSEKWSDLSQITQLSSSRSWGQNRLKARPIYKYLQAVPQGKGLLMSWPREPSRYSRSRTQGLYCKSRSQPCWCRGNTKLTEPVCVCLPCSRESLGVCTGPFTSSPHDSNVGPRWKPLK